MNKQCINYIINCYQTTNDLEDYFSKSVKIVNNNNEMNLSEIKLIINIIRNLLIIHSIFVQIGSTITTTKINLIQKCQNYHY